MQNRHVNSKTTQCVPYLHPHRELFQGDLRVKEVQLAVAIFTAATRTMVHMTNIFWLMPRLAPRVFFCPVITFSMGHSESSKTIENLRLISLHFNPLRPDPWASCSWVYRVNRFIWNAIVQQILVFWVR